MTETKKLTYKGEPLKFLIIKTNRTVRVKDGDEITVNSEELAEIKKSRVANSFKELSKKKDKEVKNDG